MIHTEVELKHQLRLDTLYVPRTVYEFAKMFPNSIAVEIIIDSNSFTRQEFNF